MSFNPPWLTVGFKSGDLVWDNQFKRAIVRIIDETLDEQNVELVCYQDGTRDGWYGKAGTLLDFDTWRCLPLTAFDIARLRKEGYV